MKFVIERDTFLPALKHLHSVIEKRGTIPILNNIHITAEAPGKVTLTSSNMDMWLTETIQAHVTGAGVTTVTAQKLVDIVGNFDKNLNVEVSADRDAMIVRSGRRRFKLGCFDAADFPTAPKLESSQKFSLGSETIVRLLQTTLPFVSDEPSRYYLTGVFLHTNEDDEARLSAVATNGHALAMTTADTPSGAQDMPPIIIPEKTCKIALKLFYEGDVSVEVCASSIVMSNSKATLMSKLIDGTFPQYQKVIPKDNPNILNVDRFALQNSINAVACIQDDRTRAIALSLKHGSVEIEATDAADSGSDVIDADYSGEDLRIGFNSRTALLVLGGITEETVSLRLDGPQDPVVFAGQGGVESKFVVMPMRI